MAQAVALGQGARGITAPNPHVGCVIVQGDEIVGRGATAPGGRPHAEAIALAEAGEGARDAHLFVTLEPCAHRSERGPTCADSIIEAGIARVTIALADPDPRTNGQGTGRLEAAGIAVEVGTGRDAAMESLGGYLTRLNLGRPLVTLKLALSIDGQAALASGESQWITGEEARAHGHALRAQSDMILVGRGTFEADRPQLNVRLLGEKPAERRRALLTSGDAPPGWDRLTSPKGVYELEGVNDLLVEGGPRAAAAFLAADLVDRLFVYRAPVLIGRGLGGVGDLGIERLADVHGRWRRAGGAALGSDRLEVYHRER